MPDIFRKCDEVCDLVVIRAAHEHTIYLYRQIP